MVLFSWMALEGVVRAEFLRARNFEYVRAAQALGVSDVVIMFRHLLPNAMVATLTFLPFILSGAITTLTSLDFLGFGLPPGSPSLGEMLGSRENKPTSALVGSNGLCHACFNFKLANFYRRSCQGCIRSKENIKIMKKEALLSVRDLSVAFQTRIAGGIKKILAVKNISFDIFQGETVALVGESGCGKTVSAQSNSKITPLSYSVTS